jgi:hypothetical protein
MSEKAVLFAMPTHVKGSVDKHGHVRAGHMSTRHKKIETAPPAERVESTLDKFIVSHGGAEHLRKTLDEMTAEQRAKLIDAMAYVGGIEHSAVLDKLSMRKPAAEDRQKLVDRLGRGVAGGFIDEQDSGVVLETYDKEGSQVALNTLRGILKQKKEAATQALPAEPVTATVAAAEAPGTSEDDQTADETVAPASIPVLNRLRDDPDLRGGLAGMKNETGWAQVGGKLMRDAATDAVTGRTMWIPNAEWWPGRPKGLKEHEVHAAVDKALAGQKLKKRELAMVTFMAQVHDERLAMEATHAELKEAVSDLAEQPAQAVDITILTSRAGDHDPDATAAVLDSWDDDKPETITRIRGELERIIGNGQKTLNVEADSGGKPAKVEPTSPGALDLFGQDTTAEQALADETRRRDEARSPNKDVPLETGDPGDLFSQARRQVDIGDAAAGPQEGATKTENGIDYVLRDGRWHRVAGAADEAEPPPPEPSAQAAVLTPSDGDDLDPNSPNYRYRDTGYVGGSRKELASQMIRRAARTGQHVSATDIDWDEIEKNPREAAELITKKNIFGDIDWTAMSQTEMAPGAGFILQKVYASVAPDPKEDTALGRRDYAVGIDSLRKRLEACKSVDEVAKTLDEIQDERDGIILTSEEEATYLAYRAAAKEEQEKVRAVDAAADALYQTYMTAQTSASRLKFDVEKRVIRKWKVSPEMQQQADDAKAEAAAKMDTWRKYRDEQGMQAITHQTKENGSISSRFEYPYKNKLHDLHARIGALRTATQERNRVENPLTRAWNALGDSFNAVVDYRRHKGSEAFARHLATAKAGRVKDWAWAEKKAGGEPRKASKRSTSFQLRVADNFEREGGRAVAVDSTSSLKEHFGLREVQSGNWVLDDPNSAKFHVEHCANAFADMADILGIPDQQASFNGRLAMAFGARGRGKAGGTVAAAHYEPVERVINLTKMAGGGSLAHEWFHFVDNIVKEATTGVGSSVDDFATENAGTLDDPDLKAAFVGLTTAMMEGPHRRTVTMQYTETEEKMAHQNMQGHYAGSIRDKIRSATGVQNAIDQVQAMYARGAFGSVDKKKSQNTRDTWKKIAAIHHAGNAQREIRYEVGAGVSMFALEAVQLDQGASGKYWSQPKEMAARAFSSFMQDKLEGAQRRNTYLVSMADNQVYKAMGEPHRPFPEGEERSRVNAAFERLFTVLRERDVLAKALELLAA